MSTSVQRFFLTMVIYLSVCIYSYVFISPYSFISFVGPAAGITTALVVYWGASVLLAITLATVLFCLFLSLGANLPVGSSLVIIALLTLMLQSIWAKQLTFAQVNQQRWLKSRRNLLLFLFKVGPFISLISASSVVILTLLENEQYGENLFFVFVSSWSSSVLFSLFFTPLLLLSQGQHQLSSAKRFFITLASLLAFVSIGLLFTISQNVQQHQRLDSFNKVRNKVIDKIKHENALTIEQINSMSALFKAKEQVSKKEFDLFAQSIFQSESSVRVLEWAPVVRYENRAEFENKFSTINEKSINGIVKKASERSQYAPIKYLYPSLNNEQALGLDVLKNAKTTIDMEQVVVQKGVVASAPISLIQDEHTNLGVLFVTAIFSANSNQKQDRDKDLLGFVIAVVQFESFFELISPDKSDNVSLFIEDVTTQEPFVLFGKKLNESYRHVEQTSLNVNSRKWRISLGENQPWQMQTKNWQMWAMLFGTTLGSVLFQVLILMMAVYSNELSVQVMRKTRELILAKENLEDKSTAKTHFLLSFTDELHASIKAINHYIKQLCRVTEKEQNQFVEQIALANNNMQRLLDMAGDLSKIELGALSITKEPLDLYGFLEQIEFMLKAENLNKNQEMQILIDSNVPHFINSDKLKIQQIIMACCGNIYKLYDNDKIRLTIRIHHQTVNTATLLLVFSSYKYETSSASQATQQSLSKDVSLYGTEIMMAKEVCQLMGGDVNLTISALGEKVLTASIRIEITSSEQQQAHQGQIFDEKHDFK